MILTKCKMLVILIFSISLLCPHAFGESYIKGTIDVARCQASCVDKFLPYTVVTDSSCRNSPDCDMCWQTCGYLHENYFLWVDMCNDLFICLPGCRQACEYWEDVKSAGIPSKEALDISVHVSDDVVLFQWSRPVDITKSQIVFVLRGFSNQRREWVVLSQTLDNSSIVQKHYIDEESRYQLVAVTQDQVVSLTNIEVDLSPPTTTSLDVSLYQDSNSTTTPHQLYMTPSNEKPSPSQQIRTGYIVLILACSLFCLSFAVWMIRRYYQRYYQRETKLSRNDSGKSKCSSSSCQDFLIPAGNVVRGEVIVQGDFGYSVVKGFCKSKPVFIKSISGADSIMKERQQLLLEISKFAHLGRYENFLSILGVVSEEDMIALAVDRMLAYTTLTHYLRCCYQDGEIIGDSLYCFIPFREAKLKTCLTSPYLLYMMQSLASTMESLYCLDYIHKELTADHIIIDPDTREFKLVDAEMSKSIFNHRVLSPPACFMSPEVLKDHEFSTWSDIWSFGMLLWQVASFGVVPLSRFSESDLYTWLCNSYRPEKVSNCSPELYELMLSCWSIYPEQRPPFSTIAAILSSMTKSAATHCQLICEANRGGGSDCVVEMPPIVSPVLDKQMLRNGVSTARQSPLWRSPAALQLPPSRARARAFLPSSSRLYATSDCNIYYLSDIDESVDDDDDEVFDEESLLHSPGEGLLNSKSTGSSNSHRSLSPSLSRSLSRKGSANLRKSSHNSVRGKLKHLLSASV